MKNCLAVGAAVLLSSSLAHSASFDCAKASTFVEKAICADPKLSRQDDALAENYRYMSASNIGEGARKDLKATQRTWIAERNKCTDTECITNAYRIRIDEICDYPVVSGVHPTCVSADAVESEFTKPKEKYSLSNQEAQGIAKSHVGIQEAQVDPELEKAWACDPRIIPFGNENALNFSSDNCNLAGYIYPQLVRPNDPPEITRLAKKILTTYHVNLGNKNTFHEFYEALEIRNKRTQEKAKLAKETKSERVRQLRSGEIKIASMQDALAVYPDQGAFIETAISPLLTPSGAILTGYVVLDAQEKPNLLRAKATTAIAIQSGQSGGGSVYIYLALTKQSVNFASDKLRINGDAQVIGKYVQNVQYQTVAGQQKTAPLLEVMYINPIR